MTYSETIAWLFEQFPAYHLQGVSAYKPSLDNIKELARAFGNPHEKMRFVHIAGTNGKGSVSNMLASILAESGEKTGLFTSPHIHDFTERIRVNGVPVSEAFVIDFCEQVRIKTWTIEPSFFEITWLMALCYFENQQCSIVVAETGLGGRLDATNIITPIVSVITNISLDHVNILGNTRTAIAGEKGGIIKPGIPVVLGESDSEILPVFEQISQKNQSDLVLANPGKVDYPKEIFGYQRINFATVSTALCVLKEKGVSITTSAIERGIKNLRRNTGFFGRLELISKDPLVILDCAHNAAGIQKTIESVSNLNKGRLHIVYGTSSDKDLEGIKAMLPANAFYYFTTFSNPRSASMSQLTAAFSDLNPGVHFFEDPHLALNTAKQSANKEDTLLITGSFFLISEFFEDFSGKTLV